jgi:hypothetical protein
MVGRCDFVAFRVPVDLRLQSPMIIIFRNCACVRTTEQSRSVEYTQPDFWRKIRYLWRKIRYEMKFGEKSVFFEKNPVFLEKYPVLIQRVQEGGLGRAGRRSRQADDPEGGPARRPA